MSTKFEPLLVDPDLSGRAFVEAHSDATDVWLQKLAVEAELETEGLALAAIGGYGRRELWPYSDVDVVLIHDKDADFGSAADALWYPVWDRGLKLGHSVIEVDEVPMFVRDELESATAFLEARLLFGDQSLVDQLLEKTHEVWNSKTQELLDKLARTVYERHIDQGDVAFHIEPNLKEGRGGLRDLHALGWAEFAIPGFSQGSLQELQDENEELLTARLELHRLSGRAGDVLRLTDQDEVAARMDARDSNDLMLRLAKAGRRIGWHSDEAWSRWETRSQRPKPQPARPAPASLNISGNDVEVLQSELDDPLVVLRLAAFAAKSGLSMSRGSLQALAERSVPLPEPWSATARRLFSEIFMSGRNAIDVVEDLDQFGLMAHILPEWEDVRCHPQRNVMHTFTVDRHLCEAAVNASLLTNQVSRPDLLVVGALLHDIGKGKPGDHTEVGMVMIEEIANRMGYPQEDADTLVLLCEHHLLLSDVATRRDLSDPGTISAVAAAVRSVSFLHLLAALTEADSIATGPAVWSSWKAGLLRDLINRTEFVLQGGAVDEVVAAGFPSKDVLGAMATGEISLSGSDQTFLAIAPIGSLLFGKIAGVLALNGRQVIDASSYTDGQMVACQFRVEQPPSGDVNWPKIEQDSLAVLEKRLALSVRINRRAREVGRYLRPRSAEAPKRAVYLDNEISDSASVIELHAPDSPGLLYGLVQAFNELGIRILTAKVQTFGDQAIDSFYVCNLDGTKLTDDARFSELKLVVDEILEGSVW